MAAPGLARRALYPPRCWAAFGRAQNQCHGISSCRGAAWARCTSHPSTLHSSKSRPSLRRVDLAEGLAQVPACGLWRQPGCQQCVTPVACSPLACRALADAQKVVAVPHAVAVKCAALVAGRRRERRNLLLRQVGAAPVTYGALAAPLDLFPARSCCCRSCWRGCRRRRCGRASRRHRLPLDIACVCSRCRQPQRALAEKPACA